MFDCHVHSNFSGDSLTNPELLCKRACELGLLGFSFTDHIDYDYPKTSYEIFELDVGEYIRVINELKIRYEKKLTVLKGVEIGLQKCALKRNEELVRSNEFDLVIGSIHVLDGLELHNGDFNKEKTKNEAYRMYFEKTLEILREYKDFDVLGHIDIIRRYGNYSDKSIAYEKFFDTIDEILKIIILNGKGIEINTSGYHYGLNSSLPGIGLLKRYKQLGGEILTFGSDAHKIDNLTFGYELAKQSAKDAGFKYLASFKSRIPEYYSIK